MTTVSLTGSAWYSFKKACNNVVNNENVVSEMIYGNQWDRVLNWLVETGGKTFDEVYGNASSWGHYGGSLPAKTGTDEDWKANNIYDLSGNASEYTQEAYNELQRSIRGGSCHLFSVSADVAERYVMEEVSSLFEDEYISTRETLYIK